MKRVLFALFILIISLDLVQAQYKPESGLLMFNVGFTTVRPENSDNRLDGNAFTLSYEKSNFEGSLAAGVSISYGKASSDSLVSFTGSEQQLQRANAGTYEVLPVMLYGKVLFGSTKVKGYLGAGIGIQFSEFEFITENKTQVKAQDSGILAGGMVGVHYFASEKVVLNGSYNFSYVANGYYQDSFAHAFNIGLAFQLD